MYNVHISVTYLLDVHIEQQLLEISSFISTRVVATADHSALLQGHGVQG